MIKKLVLRNSGMFSNINEVIYNLYEAEKNNYKLCIVWKKSCYKDPTKKGNPWNYYFENIFDIDVKDLKKIPKVNHNKDKGTILKSRKISSFYINKYLKLKPHIQEKIKVFKEKYFKEYIIGVQIRGFGKVKEINCNNKYLEGNWFEKEGIKVGIPYELYYKKIDDLLQKHHKAMIFLCSDSQDIIDKVKKDYGDKIITYDSTRTSYGEMHRNPKIKNRYKLGEDVIIEAYLLSQTNCFVNIPSISNIVMFVLSKNKDLESIELCKDHRIHYI